MTNKVKIKKNKRGRPLLGAAPMPNYSVRVSKVERDALALNFGSLANALHYLYEGIQDWKKSKNLPFEELIKPDEGIEASELILINEAVRHYLQAPPRQLDGRNTRPFKSLAEKLRRIISEG